MADWYCSSVAHAAVAQWAALHTYSVGDIVRQLATPTVGNERCFRANSITTGISGAAEPSWTLTKAGSTTDSGVTWLEVTGNATYNWTAPHALQQNMCLWEGAGDRGFTSSDHTQTTTAGVTCTAPSDTCVQVSVNRLSGNIPPLSADITNGASIAATASATVSIGGGGFWQGFTFTSGSGAGTAGLFIANNGSIGYIYQNCTFVIGGTGAFGSFNVNNTATTVRCYGCTFTYAGTSTRFVITQISQVWLFNCTFNGTAPTTQLFRSQASANLEVHGADFSAYGSGNPLCSNDANGSLTNIKFVNCELSTTQPIATITAGSSNEQYSIDLINCATGNNEATNTFIRSSGSTTTDFSVYANAGASDIVRNFSWKIVTVASGVTFTHMLKLQALQIWQRNVGAPVTATIEIQSGGTLTNKDVWVEWEFLSNSGDVLSTIVSTGVQDVLEAATNIPTSAAAWTGSGGGTFQKLQSTFTPNMIGLLRAKVFVAKASQTVYIDPKIR